MENLRGSALMVLAMAGFALEDMFLKILAGAMPVGQLLIFLGVGGLVVFALIARLQHQPFFNRDAFKPAVLLRNIGEMIAAFGYISALALTPLSSVTAILQATPLAVTLGAALFLREPVGWRRWCAITVGFVGVLIVIRPGLEGFRPASLLAVLGVGGLAIRDLATRMVPKSITSTQLSGYAFATLLPTGLVMLCFSRDAVIPQTGDLGLMAFALVFSLSGYYAIVAAMRVGDISFVTPFRYTRLVFALIIGTLVFSERPDVWTLTGAALIVGTGLYSIMREAHLRRRRRA